jgi:hypothetical protein
MSHHETAPPASNRRMTRNRWIGVGAVVLITAFLIGFLPQWTQNRALAQQLERSDLRIELLELQVRTGAALAETHRENHERARQQMTVVYPGLERARARVPAGHAQQIQEVLAERDEVITLLSRASPESTARLATLYRQLLPVTLGETGPATDRTPEPPAQR